MISYKLLLIKINMQKIYSKLFFPEAPGGDRYEWKAAETNFQIENTGFFVVKIEASVHNAKQNNSTDDDDLRIAINGFSLGKYQQHDEQISWKGFGTSSSWDGASLKGGTKTIYFFIELAKGNHVIQFYADNKPSIKSLEVFEIEKNNFQLRSLKPTGNIGSDKKGIPWMSFVFVGAYPKSLLMEVETKSAKEKSSSDGDNLKVVLNGKILQNEESKSSKYRNFYFSGDVESTGILALSDKELSGALPFENSLELWYDQQPEIVNLEINLFDAEDFWGRFELEDLRKYIIYNVWLIIASFRITLNPYSAKFLQHALNKNPENLIFEANHPIVRKIKADKSYKKIVNKLREKILAGNLEGEIWPEDLEGKINFDSYDLSTSLHGIKKIEYKSQKKKSGTIYVQLKLFDVYDFERVENIFLLKEFWNYPKNAMLNLVDNAEELKIINNFEIEINVNEQI